MKLKRILSALCILVMCLSMTAYASLPYNLQSIAIKDDGIYLNKHNPDEIVSFIVEIEGDAILASKEASSIGTDYITSKEATQNEAQLLQIQSDVIDEIANISDDHTEMISSYTHLFNGFAIKAAYGDMDKILAIPGVKNVFIAEDIKLEAHLADSTEMMMPGSIPESYPYKGEGEIIAVIDTGFNAAHDFFKAAPENPTYTENSIKAIADEFALKAESTTTDSATFASHAYYNAKIPFIYDYVGKDFDVLSSSNHGTHVAGIIGGKSGTVKSDKGNSYTINGVAPECQLLLMKIGTSGSSLDILAALDAINDAAYLGADIINCSFGTTYDSQSVSNYIWDTCFTNAKNAGILVVSSAGNSSRGFMEKSILPQNIDYSSSGMPANHSSSFTVGSANKGTKDSSQISYFSAYATSDNMELKPEITAPGGSIISSVNSGYGSMNGTSMAAPHISGASAIINEYLKETKSGLSDSERIRLIPNLMMSTADVLYNSSNVPYSPRVQGAGLVNITNAVNSTIILKNTEGESKLSLGDELSENISFTFTAENIGNTDVIFDGASLIVLTDSITSGGTIGESQLLTMDSQSISAYEEIPANSEKTISVSFTLNKAELDTLSQSFTNGFYIDGFIRLTDSTDKVPDAGIPFTGFYGDWTKASVFDSTIYDEGGSTLETDTTYATGLYTTGDGYIYPLGTSGDRYDSKYIALSPGDDVNSEIIIQFTPMRPLTEFTSTIKNASGKAISKSQLKDEQGNFIPLNKFSGYKIGLNDISSLSNGNYTLEINALHTYTKDNPTKHTLTFPFYIDTVVPEIYTAKRQDDNVIVTAYDNKHLMYVELIYGEKTLIASIENPGEGEMHNLTFDLNKINALSAGDDEITIIAYDSANNSYSQILSMLTGDIHPHLADYYFGENLSEVSFNLIKYKYVTENYNAILAFYSSDNELISLMTKSNIAHDAKTISFSGGKTDTDKSAYCKLLFWNTDGITPYDSAKLMPVPDTQ